MIKSNQEVWEHIENIHKNRDDINEGDLYERVHAYSTYSLEEVSVQDLDPEFFNLDEDKVKKYEELNTVYPAIVITSSKHIIDGAHRVKAAQNKGLKTILSYIGKDSP